MATISTISVSDDGTSLTVTFNTSVDVSAGVAGFLYGVNVSPVWWIDVAGAVTNQSVVVPLADLGATSGDTVNVDCGYSLTNPAGTKVYASDEGTSHTAYTVGGLITLNATKGTSTWSGKSSSLTRIISATVATATWSGKTSSLIPTINATKGSSVWSGTTASLESIVNAQKGISTWGGKSSPLSVSLNAAVGSASWSGKSSSISNSLIINSTPIASTWSGKASIVEPSFWDAWANAWANAWGDSWGHPLTVVPENGPAHAGRHHDKRPLKRKRYVRIEEKLYEVDNLPQVKLIFDLYAVDKSKLPELVIVDEEAKIPKLESYVSKEIKNALWDDDEDVETILALLL